MDDNYGHDDDNVFSFPDPAPPDVVSGEGLTREDLKRMNDMFGKTVELTVPGDVPVDVDGTPLGVGPSRTGPATFGGVAITRTQARELDITEEEFPNVRILEDPK